MREHALPLPASALIYRTALQGAEPRSRVAGGGACSERCGASGRVACSNRCEPSGCGKRRLLYRTSLSHQFAALEVVMRNRYPTFLVMTLLLGVVSAESQPRPADSANRTIAVSVEGHASSVADEGTLHVGFAVYGPDSATAYARGAKISTEIIEALTQAGVQRVAIESET